MRRLKPSLCLVETPAVVDPTLFYADHAKTSNSDCRANAGWQSLFFGRRTRDGAATPSEEDTGNFPAQCDVKHTAQGATRASHKRPKTRMPLPNARADLAQHLSLSDKGCR